MPFRIGADPEIFLCSTEGELVSAIGKIGGTKGLPKAFKGGYALLEDNVAAEFNVPPTQTKAGFNYAIMHGIKLVEKQAAKQDLGISNLASASFPTKELIDPAATEFGCEPDYNAWTIAQNLVPKLADKTFRSCGGHVHLELDNDQQDQIISVVRSLDLFLGVPSVMLDSDTNRRKLYGKAGTFRYKPYGVEYRTLSNFWIWREDYRNWVYEQCRLALAFHKTSNIFHDPVLGEQIQKCINNSDKDMFELLAAKFPIIIGGIEHGPLSNILPRFRQAEVGGKRLGAA